MFLPTPQIKYELYFPQPLSPHPMSTATYTGSCHCGAVAYSVDADISSPIICNCSICRRTGSILAFVPAAQLRVQQGEAELTSYHFNKNVINHLFCKHCGVRPFSRGTGPDGTAMAAINLRCLDGVEPEKLQPTLYNGRDA